MLAALAIAAAFSAAPWRLAVVAPAEGYSLPAAVFVDAFCQALSDGGARNFLVAPGTSFWPRIASLAADGWTPAGLVRAAELLGVDAVLLLDPGQPAVSVAVGGRMKRVRGPEAADEKLAQAAGAKLAAQIIEMLASGEIGGAGAPSAGEKQGQAGERREEAKAEGPQKPAGKQAEKPAAEKPERPALAGGEAEGKPEAKPAGPSEERQKPEPVRAVQLLNKARQALRDGEYSKAHKLLDEALQAGANKADVLELRAEVFAASGDADSQIKTLRELVDLAPERWRAAVTLAILLCERGLWHEAVARLRQAIHASPRNAELYLRLAQVYDRQGRLRQAADALREGAAATGSEKLRLELGRHLEQMGQAEEARQIYLALVRSDSQAVAADALDALGDLYARSGQPGRAIECYAEAAQRRNQTAILTLERYKWVYGALDEAVRVAAVGAWQVAREAAEGRGVAREQALVQVQRALQQVQQALNLCDAIYPPPERADEHGKRVLAYSLVKEGLAALLVFLDTGRQDMFEVGTRRLGQALNKWPGFAAGEQR